MNYKAYPKWATEKSRKNRKHARRTVFQENRALHSRRSKRAKEQ